MAEAKSASYSTDPALYLYTSLTAGSSHIVTATSRLETILRANRVPFKAIDIATDEKARMLWGRRAGKDESGRMRKLPGLVQMGLILGDLVEIEEWNEYGELKQNVTIYYDDFTIPPKGQAPPPALMKRAKPAAAASSSTASGTSSAAPPPAAPPLPQDKPKSSTGNDATKKSGIAATAASAAATATQPIRSIAEEAAQKAKQVHLNTLREKVYGKKDTESKDEKASDGDEKVATKPVDDNATPASSSPKNDAKEDPTGSVAGATESMSTLTIEPSSKAAGEVGLQSPTTGTWRSGVSPDESLNPIMQSPTSGRWKSEGGDGSGVKKHRGSVVADAAPEQVAAIETVTAIPEASKEGSEDEAT
ncbi:hypothetical protein F4778DRAFT_103413 [Xylariomycetidae sp. FL2044]|nr:hypothetical protein F4778DRAFT_103413 [Xylariomycetidae sp. FL2044]